eukprot:2859586-Pyramimonas_sp.AAC.1
MPITYCRERNRTQVADAWAEQRTVYVRQIAQVSVKRSSPPASETGPLCEFRVPPGDVRGSGGGQEGVRRGSGEGQNYLYPLMSNLFDGVPSRDAGAGSVDCL